MSRRGSDAATQSATRREEEVDSDGPEEESNEGRRRSIKGIDKTRRAEKSAGRRSRAPPPTDGPSLDSKRPRPGQGREEEDKSGPTMEGTTVSPGRDHAQAPASPPAHTLDPALFAASFSKSRSQPQPRRDVRAKETTSANTKKRFGMARGRDGQPMKRLDDGRTTVRVLEERPSPASKGTASEETLAPPPALTASQALPSAKIRAFRKHKLGLKTRSGAGQKKQGSQGRKRLAGLAGFSLHQRNGL